VEREQLMQRPTRMSSFALAFDRPAPWRLFLLSGLLISALYTIPANKIYYDSLPVVVVCFTLLALIAGIRIHRPAFAWPWFALIAGCLPLLVGDSLWLYGDGIVGGSTTLTNRASVLELVRWLGPGAELLEPAAWRATLRDELSQMATAYGEGVGL